MEAAPAKRKPSAADRLPSSLRQAALIPGVLSVAVFVFWAAAEGGFAETRWMPGALFLLGLLAAVAFAYRPRWSRLPLAARLALMLLALFTAWSFLSIIWAEVPATAWDGANRALMYLAVYAIFLLVVWRASTASLILGLYSVGLAVVGVVVLLDAAGAADAALSLVAGRFGEPTGYPNAVAALFIGGFWPALLLASRPETPWPLRGLMLATAGFLIQFALLPQSRGSLIVFPIALVLYIALAPQRLRTLQMLLAIAVASLLASGAVLDVFTVTEANGDIGAALSDALGAMAFSFLALLGVGALVGLSDSRVTVSRTAARAAAAGWALAAVAAVVVLIVAIGNPVSWADSRWADFKRGYESTSFDESRFTGQLGSNRYDFWTVALSNEFAEAPLIGNGSENFAVGYLRERDSGEEPFDPHSLPLLVLAGTGLVGGLLFGGFVVASLIAVGRPRWRAPSSLTAGVAAASLGAFGYWFLHSSGDWLWSFSAITAPILAWLGMSASLGASSDPDAPATEVAIASRARSSTPKLIFGGVGAVVFLLAALSLALPWGAARDVELAASGWRSNPEAAYTRLDRARNLNLLSARPDLLAGTIAAERGETERARLAFGRAIEREPTNWYAHLQLGTLLAFDGRHPAALEQLREAAALNPADPLIREAIQGVRRRDPLSLEALSSELLGRVCSRVGRTSATDYCG